MSLSLLCSPANYSYGFNKNKLWDKLDIEIRNAKIVTTWDILKRWTKLGYKEKIHILMDEYYLSYSRVEDVIQENFDEAG